VGDPRVLQRHRRVVGSQLIGKNESTSCRSAIETPSVDVGVPDRGSRYPPWGASDALGDICPGALPRPEQRVPVGQHARSDCGGFGPRLADRVPNALVGASTRCGRRALASRSWI
jgi:hypothetical protein